MQKVSQVETKFTYETSLVFKIILIPSRYRAVLCSDIFFHVTHFCKVPVSPVLYTFFLWDKNQCLLHETLFFLTRRDYFVLYQLAVRNDLQQCPSSLFPIRNYLGVANRGKIVVSLLYFHQLSPDNIGVINEFMGKKAWVAAIYNVFQLPIYMLEHWGLINQRKSFAITRIPRAWDVASYIPQVLSR